MGTGAVQEEEINVQVESRRKKTMSWNEPVCTGAVQEASVEPDDLEALDAREQEEPSEEACKVESPEQEQPSEEAFKVESHEQEEPSEEAFKVESQNASDEQF